jgi:hypothetical protein
MSGAGGSAKSESAPGGGAVARGATAEKGDSQSVLSLLQARELGVGRQTLGARRRTSVTSPQKFSRSVRGSAALVSRLELEAVHEWHDGCVNTISFTPSGTALISGSDDRHIVVGDWQTVRSTPVAMPVLALARARRRRTWCAPGGRRWKRASERTGSVLTHDAHATAGSREIKVAQRTPQQRLPGKMPAL